MESALPVIEVVTFRANKTCSDDPGLFKEICDMVAATTRFVGSISDIKSERANRRTGWVSVKTMYWGRSVEQPPVLLTQQPNPDVWRVFIWLLCE